MSQADQDIAVEASLQKTGLGSAAVKDDGVVPLIDLASPMAAEDLWKAATKVGFFSVMNHGISQSLIDDAFASSAGFFQQSLEDKMNQAPFDAAHNAGFEYFKQIRPSTGVADQKESFQVTARRNVMEDRWPSAAFRGTAEQLTKAAHTL
jgi:isopenicillin N synthase-like dioxygenase